MKLTDEQLEILGSKYRLSPRERDVLSLLFEGLPTNQDIADRLNTTEAAVKSAVRTLYLKSQTASKHELVLKLLHDVLDELRSREIDLLRRQKKPED